MDSIVSQRPIQVKIVQINFSLSHMGNVGFIASGQIRKTQWSEKCPERKNMVRLKSLRCMIFDWSRNFHIGKSKHNEGKYLYQLYYWTTLFVFKQKHFIETKRKFMVNKFAYTCFGTRAGNWSYQEKQCRNSQTPDDRTKLIIITKATNIHALLGWPTEELFHWGILKILD